MNCIRWTRRAVTTAAVAISLCALICSSVRAQAMPAPPAAASAPTTGTGSVAGIITDAAAHPAAGVQIEVSGPVTRHTQTDAQGSFSIDELPPGSYHVNVTKAGFTPVQDDVRVSAGTITNAKLQLAATSFSSIKQIGRVSVASNAANALNTSTAAVSTVSGSTFIDQGQLNVNRLLNEVPGIVVGVASRFGNDQIGNGASPLVTGIPQIRGSLPYETASLIDGHPISIGVYGTFNPAFINPYMLGDVEVVKGPGASAPNINYAIGGTVNFRTLEPTRVPRQSFDVGLDQFGGQNANVRATGTLPNGKVGYAIDYATQGTPGFARGYNPLDPLNLSSGATINGQTVCGSAATAGKCGPSVVGVKTPFAAAFNLTAPAVLCCPQIPMQSNARNELAKLRYNFTPSTSLTLSYLGAQSTGSRYAADLFVFPSYFFGPPAGYTGLLQPNAPVFQNLQGDSQLATEANLYQVEFHTVAGPATISARYYAAAVNTGNLESGQGPTPGQETVSGILYGGVPLGTNVTPTIFNGTPATVTLSNQYNGVRTKDKLNGFTVEADLPVNANVYSVSYDAIHTKSSAQTTSSFASADVTTVPPGSGQAYQTIMLRGQFALRPGLQATLSNYATSYTDHYTQDFGATFNDSTHAYDAPRLALAWRPNSDLAVRAATGFSIAPPYINLLTNSAPQPDRKPPTYFSTTANSGDISPETSFGWDLGADQRLRKNTVLSFDIYETTLRNQFLSTTALAGSYNLAAGNPYSGNPGTYPLYVTQTKNLGHSRYEGIELAVHRDPVIGLGYKLQGELQRAFTYDLPAGFYNTAAGPNTANLGVLPNENFGTTGQGYNGLSATRVPYAQGYAELNARLRSGAYVLVGATYFGNNNSYNEPAFGVVNASFRQPLSKRSSLLFAVTNITGAYADYAYNIYGGIPTPLVNGQLGYTAANVIGPSTASLTLHVDL